MFTERVQSRNRQKEATRQRVLTAADALFREIGFDATTIRSIAASAQVSVGTVMAVGDKNAILVAVYDEWIADVHRQRSVAGRADVSAQDNAPAEVLGLFLPFLEHFARDTALSRVYASIIVGGRVDSEIFRSLGLALTDEIEQTLRRAGHDSTRAVQGAQVIYFAYLGMLMSVGVGDDLNRLKGVIDFVTNQSDGGER